MHLAILMFNGAMHSAVTGVVDLLALSNTILAQQGRSPAFEWTYVAAGKLAVRTSGGHLFQANCNVDDSGDYDAVFIPGVVLTVSLFDENAARIKAKAWLRRAHAKGAVIGASCGGVFLLAETGLLDNRKATTTWWLQSELKQRYPKIELGPVNTNQLVDD